MNAIDIQKLNQELTDRINEICNRIEHKLNAPVLVNCNHVVVSKDFLYYVIRDNNGHAGVGFTQDDNAVRLTQRWQRHSNLSSPRKWDSKHWQVFLGTKIFTTGSGSPLPIKQSKQNGTNHQIKRTSH